MRCVCAYVSISQRMFFYLLASYKLSLELRPARPITARACHLSIRHFLWSHLPSTACLGHADVLRANILHSDGRLSTKIYRNHLSGPLHTVPRSCGYLAMLICLLHA